MTALIERGYIKHGMNLARQGWQKAFAQMARLKDDALMDQPSAATQWERQEWEWTQVDSTAK